MAEVYVAQSRGISGFEKRVAIKKILPQHSHNERFIDMLVDEAKITVSLTHPNIAQVYELGLDGEDYFIVMEYVEGRPLNRLMQRVDERGLDVIRIEHAAHVMAEVSQGLDNAHRQTDQKGNPLGIVHRDVSPQNVLISYSGAVKLIDFGIARAEGRINQTSHGVIKGKLRYLAPEIAAGEEPDSRADVFCCGIVLFEMLTGEAMFAPKSDMEAIELATEARVKSPRSRNKKVPQDLDDICMKALKRDRNERYQRAQDLHSDLRVFLNQHYPKFLQTDLGDFMKRMFAPEIEEERRLDEAAERLAQRIANDIEDEDDPTLAAVPGALVGPLPGDRKGYKQLVTRIGLEGAPMKLAGADGGRAMQVVAADAAGHRPPIERGRAEDLGGVGTMPPQGIANTKIDDTPPAWVSAAEPTVKANNPFVQSKSVLPTVMGPPPEDEDAEETADQPSSVALRETHDKDHEKPEVQARTASLHVWEENESQAVVSPRGATKVREPSEVPDLRSKKGMIRVAMAAVGVLSAGLLAALIFSPSEEKVVIPAADDTITIAPVEITRDDTPPPVQAPPPVPLEPASVVIDVKPQVRVDVDIDGRRERRRAITPLEIQGLKPGTPHRIRIAADGYRSEEMSRVFAPGSRTQLALTLRAATGTIILSGKVGSVRASQGRVKGNRIVNLRLDSEVEIRVDRPGARAWSKTIYVKDPDPMTIKVPAPKMLPKGTLIVNARPLSTVYIDGKGYGKTPVRARITPGRHRILLKGPNGQKKSFNRSVGAGKTTTFTYRWPRR